ncbi:NAD-dependent epimerase/dehydratase family protein [Chlorobium sp. N1]|uniref:NAD-dependent epimerase/dehydratase family protein n=1 Tax=Chlorobium sp. N1 TaxID=2491138 RepID=UPI00103D9C62|nr:NAD-dependent epimerase/dehydratase family protein [Chlorobium sp. N1]TCD48006.1 NAD-dependent epimerase/dehydratase family protein [Chlorobium sp. N1]
MKNESISILGCGWLGLPLAGALVREGYAVKGSTTSEAHLPLLQETGVEPYLLSLEPELEGDEAADFLQSDTLVVNFPPERREDIEEYHVLQFSSLIDAIRLSPVKNVLMVSSTSVYPALGREVTEEDALEPESPSGRALLSVEEMLMQERGFQTTVVRFSGLVGYDRTPAGYLGRMKEIASPGQPMNLIHRDDCIRIIMEIIRLGQWGEVFNACAPVHPKRIDYYRKAALKAGIELPPAVVGEAPFKIVDSCKLVNAIGYAFLHPDPMDDL